MEKAKEEKPVPKRKRTKAIIIILTELYLYFTSEKFNPDDSMRRVPSDTSFDPKMLWPVLGGKGPFPKESI